MFSVNWPSKEAEKDYIEFELFQRKWFFIHKVCIFWASFCAFVWVWIFHWPAIWVAMAHFPQIDFRYRWLSETISNALGIFDTTFSEQLIAEHSDLVDAFFNDNVYEKSDAHKQILFVWRTFYDKLVEESITVLEEGKQHQPKMPSEII